MKASPRRTLALGVALPSLTVATPAAADAPAPDASDAATPVSSPPTDPHDARLVVDPKAPAVGLVFGASGSTLAMPGSAFLPYASYLAGGGHWGPSLGVSWQKPRDGRWAFVPEVWYRQFGTRVGSTALVFDAIATPFLFRKYGVQHTPITPFVEIGPEVSFALGSRVVSKFFPYAYAYTYSYGVWGIVNRVDAGARLGFGVSFPVQNTRATLSVQTYQGLVPKMGPMPILNRQVSINGGLYFGRPKKP